MAYFMGVDLGTSSAKALIVEGRGEAVALAAEAYDIAIPRPGWAEQDADGLWRACAACIRRALSASGLASEAIAAVGLSGQMHGLVALDEGLRPVRPAIIWADRRSAAQVEHLRGLGAEDVALNPAATGFLLPSLMWMRENEPERFGRVAHVLLPKDYVRLMLCGELGTDVTDASGTLAMDGARRDWSLPLLDALGLDAALFPEVHMPSQVAGCVMARAAADTGLRAGTPVIYGGGDGPMQLVGNGVVRPGMLTANIGTASQIDLITGSPLIDERHRMQLFCHAPEGRWIAMGASLNGGGTLKWLKNAFFDPQTTYRDLDALAEAVPAGSAGLLALPYLCGERSPHMDPCARGTFSGFTLSHTRAHLVRAVMEGVVFALRDCLEVLEALSPQVSGDLIASGGGARSALWRQMQADILKKRVFTTRSTEEACLGAALTAAVGAGEFRDIDEAASVVRMNPEVTEPNPRNFALYDERFAQFQQLYRDNRALFSRMDAQG